MDNTHQSRRSSRIMPFKVAKYIGRSNFLLSFVLNKSTCSFTSMMRKYPLLTALLLAASPWLHAQNSPAENNEYELNTGWKCQAIEKVKAAGEKVSAPGFSISGWLDATVPGTGLTTLINNKLEPDPFYGLNNEKIPDIYTTGRDHYTYWFVKNFREPAPG